MRFSLRALIVATAFIALGVSAWVHYLGPMWFSSEDLELSLRRDLNIATSAQMTIVDEGIRPWGLIREQRYAWVIIETSSEFLVIGAWRRDDPFEDSTPWRTGGHWEGHEPERYPFRFTFRERPTEAEIDDCIRYSEGYW